MRISYIDDEQFEGQFALWQANCRRSMKGKAGQQALRDLEAALLALPDKRLIHGSLVDDQGGVCAIAAYGKYKGVDLSKFDPEDSSNEVGIEAGMPRLVAWKVVELNDVLLDTVWEIADGPLQRWSATYKGGIPLIREMTPEERYEKVLTWVRSQLGVDQIGEPT